MLKIFSSELRDGIRRLQNATRGEITVLTERLAKQMEEEAKLKAPWTDRTGNARRTMLGFSFPLDENDEDIVSGIAGRMPYSPNLEFFFREKYAILRPVVNSHSEDVVGQLAKIFRDMRIK